MSKKCAVCEDSAFGFNPLCKKHLEMTKTGEVKKYVDILLKESSKINGLNLPHLNQHDKNQMR